MRTFRDDLTESFRDPEFVKEFGAAQAKSAFALTLARARRKAGVTQQELADRFGVSQSYIAKLEGGEANPTLSTIGSLLSVVGLRLSTDAIPLLAAPGDVTEAEEIRHRWAIQ
jgi:transcriptional regulator with XRE-family HTH domain